MGNNNGLHEDSSEVLEIITFAKCKEAELRSHVINIVFKRILQINVLLTNISNTGIVSYFLCLIQGYLPKFCPLWR